MAESVCFDMVRRPKGGWRDLSVKEWLLWPAYCYRVVAPEARYEERNLFERVVLGLAKARVSQSEDQARYTGLDSRLLETIQSQLAVEGLLNPDGRISEKGDAELDSEGLGQEKLVTGYVFQDPYTGRLWDRFVEAPQIAEVETNGVVRTLIRGPLGNQFRTNAFHQRHPLQTPSAPGPEEVTLALRRFRRHLKRNQSLVDQARSSANDAFDSEQGWIEEEPEQSVAGFDTVVNKVTIQDLSPVPCHLALCIYSRSSIPLPSTLLATDPFGQIGASDPLLSQILDTAHASQDSALARRIDGMFEHEKSAGLREFRATMESLRLKAERRVEEQIGFDSREHSIFPRLVGMELLGLEAEALGEQGGDKEIAAIGSGRDVLEAILHDVADAVPYQGLERHVDLPLSERTPKGFGSVLEGAAESLGIRTPLPSNLMNPNKLKMIFGRLNALTRGKYGLSRVLIRELVELCLFAALGLPDHPFARAASKDEALVDRIFALANVVNAAKHGDRPPDDATIESVRQEIYQLAKALIPSFGNVGEEEQ